MIAAQTPSAEDHTRTAAVAGLIAGSLIAFGLICWIAANWPGLHRLTKIGLVGGVLLTAAVVAAVFDRLRLPALMLATGAVGGLLALIGQIYPSGADAWQLFAWWAVLSLPFALAARSDAVWSLWAVVATAGISLWRAQDAGPAFAESVAPWAMIAALAAFLSPFAPIARWRGDSRWAFRIATLCLIGLVTVEGVGIFTTKGDTLSLASLAVLAAGGYVLTRTRPLELGLLALVALAIDVVIIVRVAVLLAPKGPEIAAMLLIGFFAAGIIAASVLVLRQLMAASAPVAQTRVAGSSRTVDGDPAISWPLVMLSGLGAIIAAVPFVALYVLLFGSVITTATGSSVLGFLTLGGAILLLQGGASLGFQQMFGMIAAVVGVALIGWAAIEVSERNAGFILCAVIAGTAVLLPARWMRSLCGFAAAGALFLSVYARAGGRTDDAHVAMLILTALSATALFLPNRDGLRSFVAGWVAATLIALMILAGRPFLIGGSTSTIADIGGVFRQPPSVAVQALSMALGVAGCVLLFGASARWRGAPAFALAAAAIVLTYWSPFLGGALFVFACATMTGERILAVLAAIAVLWIVSAAYYALNWTLTEKAWTMIGLGLAIGGVTLATRPAGGAPAGLRPRLPGVATALLIACGLAVTGGAAGMAVASAETIIRHGRQIFIPLRPVDPRSMMQGDYMAVAFDTSHLPAPEAGAREVRAVADVDARGVATLLLPPLRGPDTIDVLLRTKSRRWFVGSNAWFFPEGHADRFVSAKFGIFRVGTDGRLLLVGLADKDLAPLSVLN